MFLWFFFFFFCQLCFNQCVCVRVLDCCFIGWVCISYEGLPLQVGPIGSYPRRSGLGPLHNILSIYSTLIGTGIGCPQWWHHTSSHNADQGYYEILPKFLPTSEITGLNFPYRMFLYIILRKNFKFHLSTSCGNIQHGEAHVPLQPIGNLFIAWCIYTLQWLGIKNLSNAAAPYNKLLGL